MSFTVQNKFELGQVVYMRKSDKSVITGRISAVKAVFSGFFKDGMIEYIITQIVNGKEERTLCFLESDVFADANDAFVIKPEK